MEKLYKGTAKSGRFKLYDINGVEIQDNREFQDLNTVVYKEFGIELKLFQLFRHHLKTNPSEQRKMEVRPEDNDGKTSETFDIYLDPAKHTSVHGIPLAAARIQILLDLEPEELH